MQQAISSRSLHYLHKSFSWCYTSSSNPKPGYYVIDRVDFPISIDDRSNYRLRVILHLFIALFVLVCCVTWLSSIISTFSIESITWLLPRYLSLFVKLRAYLIGHLVLPRHVTLVTLCLNFFLGGTKLFFNNILLTIHNKIAKITTYSKRSSLFHTN